MAWGGCGCLQLPLKKWGNTKLRNQDGIRATHLEQDNPWVLQSPRGWSPPEAPGGARRSLSFLTEDGTDPLSSTRRSLLEELELGGGCGLGEPPLWPGCPPEPPSLAVPTLTPWPPMEPGGSALPPQPLASSTLLWAGDEPGEGPRGRTVGGRTRGPRRVLPKPSAGDNPVPSPWRGFGPGGSPQCCRRVPEGPWAPPRAPPRTPPRAPLLRAGLSSCPGVSQSPGDSDILGAAAQHRPPVPQRPPMGWAGLGIVPPAVPNLRMRGLEVGAEGWDRSSLGDSSAGSECFVSAVETLEPSEAGGSLGAQHHQSPQLRAAGGLEQSEASSPAGVVPWESPPAIPLDTEPVQGEDFWGGSRAAPHCQDGSEVGDLRELRVQLQGCSLRGSPSQTSGPLAAGGITPQGQEPPKFLHVTPRTKSRLQAAAARLDPSSASSLFEETLEMPRRPPRLRAPRGVLRHPATASGHPVTPWGEAVSSGDGEGTGSLDDTEILPGASSQPSLSPGASRSLSSSPTVLLAPGDPAHPQNSPGSSPTVLLPPGDPAHPQNSPGSSPTVLLALGDPGHPQNSPSDRWGSPLAAGRVLEGGSVWPDPSSLGTHQPQGSSSPPLSPRLPGRAVLELGTPAVPPAPPGCSTHRSGDHPGDEQQGQAPTEGQSPEATTSPEAAQGQGRFPELPRPLSDEGLRRRLRALGEDPGPVTELTRGLYRRRLEELVQRPRGTRAAVPGVLAAVPGSSTATPGHSPELVAALQTGHVPDCAQDELELTREFDRPDRNRHWREGLVKSSFNYLLLDPRTCRSVPTT
ncbi:ankyrin repeat and LEM domain-containing protein 1 isoform X2 [Apus apus]|uniref:ankyrin repeat and LEM domain-containing protein 1 isoform X2 n=1 Tax=Apus apus TaxID=8895 RepID=UPI0021F81510|nr:ankyrin repeat and LEM domain-containing protein 1 isoform X2 [Apus apus]